MTTYTARVVGGTSQPAYQSFVRFDINESIQLNWPSSGLNDGAHSIAIWTQIDPLIDNLTVSLPSALQVSTGTTVNIINIGANAFDLLDYSGDLIQTFTVGTQVTYYLTDNTTPAGNWDVFLSQVVEPGTGTVQSVSATVVGNGLTIQGSPITTIGNLQFQLDDKLQQLPTLNNQQGLLINNGPNLIVRSIGGGNNISVVNGNGVLGNPIISLAPNLDGIDEIQTTSLTATTGNFTNLNVVNIPSVVGTLIAAFGVFFQGSVTNPQLTVYSFNVASVVSVAANQIRVNFINPLQVGVAPTYLGNTASSLMTYAPDYSSVLIQQTFTSNGILRWGIFKIG